MKSSSFVSWSKIGARAHTTLDFAGLHNFIVYFYNHISIYAYFYTRARIYIYTSIHTVCIALHTAFAFAYGLGHIHCRRISNMFSHTHYNCGRASSSSALIAVGARCEFDLCSSLLNWEYERAKSMCIFDYTHTHTRTLCAFISKALSSVVCVCVWWRSERRHSTFMACK